MLLYYCICNILYSFSTLIKTDLYFYIIDIAKVSAMICEYFAAAVDAIRQMECEPYCVSTNRIEVNYI